MLALIVFAAGLEHAPTRSCCATCSTRASVEHDTTLLTWLTIAMIAIAIVTSAFSVLQTYLSNIVGQRVMHDLRAAVYKHLQRMSLAFFTRTRTGEVQSRIANDIGGLDSVVTTTATTIAQNATTVIAAIVAMCLLDWRLAVISLVFVPLFVWLTRRVGKVRRRITMVQQRRLADLSALVAESLSVSGIMLGKTMGRGGDLADRFTGESQEIADLEVRSRMAGRWVMSTIQMTFAIQPAIIYWLAGQSFDRPHDLARHRGRVHDPADPAAVPDPVAARRRRRHGGVAGAVRPHLRVPRPAGRHRRGRASGAAAPERAARRGALRGRLVPLRGAEPAGPVGAERWTVHDIDLVVPAGTRTAIVGETGAGKTTLGYLVARLYEPQQGRVTIDGVDVRDASLASLAATVGVVSQETYLFHASVRENLRFASPRRPTRRSRTPPARPGSTT